MSFASKHVLFKYPDFLLYFLGRFISAAGDKIFTIALAVWMMSDGSPENKMHLGFLLAMNTLPVVLFGPLAGSLADKFNRKTCMLIADGSRALVLLMTAYLLVSGNLHIAMMYGICFLLALFVPLFESSASASVMHLVAEEDLEQAVALDSSVVSLSEIVGASLGGILVALIHFEGALLLNCCSFLLSFVCIALIRTKLPAPGGGESHYQAIIEGLNFIWHNKVVCRLLTVFGLVNFFTAPIFLLLPIMVRFNLHIPETAIGQWIAGFEVALAVGAGGTAFFLSVKNCIKRPYIALFCSLLVFAATYILISVLSVTWFIVLALILAGCALAVINTTAMSLFQRMVPDEMKGRFFASLTTCCFAAIPLSYIVTGYLSQHFSARTLFCVDGIMILCISSLMIKLVKKERTTGI